MRMHKVLALLAALGAAEHVEPDGGDGDAAAAAPLADPERLRELASQQRVLSERVAELERLAFDGQGNPLAPEETSLLEQFGVSAREFLVHRLSPRTDPECRWHYAKARCAPMCTCGFQYKFGDYTLSRSCRLLPPERVDAACDPRSIEDEAGAFEKLSRFATKLAVRARPGLAWGLRGVVGVGACVDKDGAHMNRSAIIRCRPRLGKCVAASERPAACTLSPRPLGLQVLCNTSQAPEALATLYILPYTGS